MQEHAAVSEADPGAHVAVCVALGLHALHALHPKPLP